MISGHAIVIGPCRRVGNGRPRDSYAYRATFHAFPTRPDAAARQGSTTVPPHRAAQTSRRPKAGWCGRRWPEQSLQSVRVPQPWRSRHPGADQAGLEHHGTTPRPSGSDPPRCPVGTGCPASDAQRMLCLSTGKTSRTSGHAQDRTSRSVPGSPRRTMAVEFDVLFSSRLGKNWTSAEIALPSTDTTHPVASSHSVVAEPGPVLNLVDAPSLIHGPSRLLACRRSERARPREVRQYLHPMAAPRSRRDRSPRP